MRAPPLLLLMVAASLAVDPLSRLNPELSACDLEESRWLSGELRCGPSCAEALTKSEVDELCQRRAGERQRRLQEARLSSCCERSAFSALDGPARASVHGGGTRCTQTLRGLLQLDEVVARLECSFHDIMERYDCQQNYSVRHSCADCQNTYRRWLCATLLPLHMTDEELDMSAMAWFGPDAALAGNRQRRSRAGERRGTADAARRRSALHIAGHLDRRWEAGGVIGRWVRAAAAGPGRPSHRIKPCLGVCQQVEQHCPYFLPGDRAPAYPTQYAGEATFICLDPMIQETGEQAERSNYGPVDCCYDYCNGTVCAKCSQNLRSNNLTLLPDDTCPIFEEPAPSTCASATQHRTQRALLSINMLIFLIRTIRTVIQLCNEKL